MNKIKYPRTKIENITEYLYGNTVNDPYRWLEKSDSIEVKKWDKKQNQYAHKVLNKIPHRGALKKEFEKNLSVDLIEIPLHKNGRIFFMKHTKLNNQPILYTQGSLNGKCEILINPNSLSKEGGTALDWWYPSEDGSLLAYGLSKDGAEDSTLFILDVKTKKKLNDRIFNVRHCDIAWLSDNTGFYYTRKPIPGTVAWGDEHYYQRIYFHKIGTDYKNDPVVFGERRSKEDLFLIELSSDGQFLLVTAHQGWINTNIYILDRYKNEWITLIEKIDANFYATLHRGFIYIKTNYKSSNYTIHSVPIEKAGMGMNAWKTIIKEGTYPIQKFQIFSHYLAITTIENVIYRLKIFTLDGKFLKEIKLPQGSISNLSAGNESEELFFDFESFFTPLTIYKIKSPSLITSVWQKIDNHINRSSYQIKQIWYKSGNGTRVPLFLIYKKNSNKKFIRNGNNPTLLTGYGGFSGSLTPYFIPSIVPFLERGGLYAIANIRGGGEFGEKWHKAGMLDKKQNSFNDFIKAAEWLIKHRYTNKEKLTIQGISNGGLLIAAVLVQRPDLFQAAVAQVPFFDMLRFEKSFIGRLCIQEYGDPGNKKQFLNLIKYSPYHNLRKNIAYPAILIATGKNDTRIDPFHARKMCASFQQATISHRPVLLRIETNSGHGVDKPLVLTIKELVDIWSFIFWQLGILKYK